MSDSHTLFRRSEKYFKYRGTGGPPDIFTGGSIASSSSIPVSATSVSSLDTGSSSIDFPGSKEKEKEKETETETRRRRKKVVEVAGLPSLRGLGVLDLSRRSVGQTGLDGVVTEVDDSVRSKTNEQEDDVKRAGWEMDEDMAGGRGTTFGEQVEEGNIKPIKLLSPHKEGSEGKNAWLLGDGLILIPQYFDAEEQISILRSSLSQYTLPPNPLNLSSHYDLPTSPPSTSTNPIRPEEESLFSLYLKQSDYIIPTKASKQGLISTEISRESPRASSPSPSPVPSSVSPAGGSGGKTTSGGKREKKRSLLGEKRPLINHAPASEEGYAQIFAKVKDWQGDAPSIKLRPKTAKELVEKELRWANLGWVYNWTNKAYDFTTPEPIPFPAELQRKCIDIVQSVPWAQVFPARFSDSINTDAAIDSVQASAKEGAKEKETNRIIPDWQTWDRDYQPDTGIVNFYGMKDTLMGHVDRSELDPYRPLISISVGHAAICLVGGPTRDTSPIPIVLRSGDVLIMSGKARSFYHGVPRIMEDTLPRYFLENDNDDKEIRACKRYIRNARININARQVFPRGFIRPALHEENSPPMAIKDVDRVLLVIPLTELKLSSAHLESIRNAARHTRMQLLIYFVGDSLANSISLRPWESMQSFLGIAYTAAVQELARLQRILCDVDVLVQGFCEKETKLSGILDRVICPLGLKDTVKNALATPPLAWIAPKNVSVDIPAFSPAKSAIVNQHKVVALGGTFDHLHAGHKILLCMAVYVTQKKLIVGISDDALLKSKQYSDQLEPLAIRLERVRKFLLSINPDLEYELVALHEVCGPTATEEDIQALVLSKESAQGGEFIKRVREEKKLSPLKIYVIDVITSSSDDPSSAANAQNSKLSLAEEDNIEKLKDMKLGSTYIRKWLSERSNVVSSSHQS